MSTLTKPSDAVAGVDGEFAARIEQLARYLAAHEGRRPDPDEPLAWWLAEQRALPRADPRAKILAAMNASPSQPRPVAQAKRWGGFFAFLDQLDRIAPGDDEAWSRLPQHLRAWANSQVVRLASGTLRPAEELVLRARPYWRFDQTLTAKARKRTSEAIGLEAVARWQKEHPGMPVPEDLVVEGLAVQPWWAAVRQQYANGSLAPVLRNRLEALKLDARTERRRAQDENRRHQDQLIAAIAAFTAAEGHSRIPYTATTDKGLPFGAAADRWRRMRRRGTLDEALRAALEAIPMWRWTAGPVPRHRAKPGTAPEPPDTSVWQRAPTLRQFSGE